MVRPRPRIDADFDHDDSIDPLAGQDSDQWRTIATTLDPRFAPFSEIDRNDEQDFVENHAHHSQSKSVLRIGRYTIFDQLDSRGTEHTYKAFDPKLKRVVTLKVVRLSDQSISSSERRRSFIRRQMLSEAKAMAQLSHPNIVPIFDVGTTEDGIYLAMEFVAGKSLRMWLDSNRDNWKEALRLLWGAGQGLFAMHRAGFVHRNFVPENIIIGADGRARLQDFGQVVQRVRDPKIESEAGDSIGTTDTPPDPTSSYTDLINEVMGTPGYVAPEQYQHGRGNELSNQFSFAIVLYEAIYGRLPFSSTALLQARSARDLGLRFPEHRPKWVRKVLKKALAFDPDERYSSVRFLLNDIERYIENPSTLWWTFGSIALVVAGGVYLSGLWSSVSPACDLDSHEISSIWNHEQRDQAASAFLASSRRFSVDSWEKTSSYLDNYKRQWIDTYTDTCQQMQDDAQTKRDSAHLDHQLQCLSRRLEQFRLLAELFENASDSVVEHSISAVMQLQSAEECKDPDTPESRLQLPIDPVRRAQIVEVQGALDRNGILVISGNLDEAETQARMNLERAKQLNYPPLLIDAYTSYADVLIHRWEFQRILPLQQNALALAMSIDDSTRAAEIIGYLVHSRSLVSPNLEGLKDLIRWATALNERAGTDPVAKANLLNSIGNIYFNFDDVRSAKLAYSEGLSVQGSRKIHRSFLLMNLGQCKISERKLSEAEIHLKNSLKLLREIYGKDHPQLSHITSVLGTLAFYRSNYRESLIHFDKAILLSTRDNGQVGPEALPAYWFRGHSLRNLGFLRDAISNAKMQVEADEEFSEPNHPRICIDYYHLAEFLDEFGDQTQFFDVAGQLDELAKEYPKDDRCQRNAAWVRTLALIRQGKFKEAEKQLRIVSSLRKKIGKFHEFGEKIVKLRVELAESQGQLADAKRILEQYIVELEKSSWMSQAGYLRSLLWLGSIEQKLENYGMARTRLVEVEKRLIAIAGRDSMRQAEVELIRGKILIGEKRWMEAQELLALGRDLADGVQSSRLLLADLELNLAKAKYMQSNLRSESMGLASRAQKRLVNLLHPGHPLLIEIRKFLENCCNQ